MKKFLSILLVLCMSVSLLSGVSFAATVVDSGTCGANLTWTLDSEGTLTISGEGAMTNYDNDYYKTNSPWRKERQVRRIIIEEGVTSIGNEAFYECYATSVIIPDTVTRIGAGAFTRVPLKEVFIPESVTRIDENAFYQCSLQSVIIPNSVTRISEYAFAYSALIDITIPNSVTTIGSSAFYDCNLISITIPNSVTTIGDYAFSSCNLTSITIPNSVTTIGKKAFYGCNRLTAITVNSGNQNYCDVDGVLFNKAKTTLIQYPSDKTDSSYTIPDSVTTIGNSAFSDCNRLTSVTIGNSVTTIGAYAFNNCDSLTSVTIGNSVTTIGDNAFYSCNSLTSVTIPDSVTTIGDSAFEYCGNLISITIPSSVTTIDNYAFWGCSSLTDIYFSGTESDWEKIFIAGFNENFTSATIHFVDNTSIVNKRGRGAAWFTLRDSTGALYANQAVTYMFSGDDTVYSATTDANGVVGILTGELTSSGNTAETYSFTVDFLNTDLLQDSFQFKVTVTPPEYTQTWSGALTFGAAAKLEGGLFDFGISGKHERSFTMEEIIHDGTRDLRLATAADRAVAASTEIGLDMGPASIVEYGSEMGVSNELGRGCYIENYDPENQSQRKQIELFLLDTALGFSNDNENAVVQKILRAWASLNGTSTYNEETVSLGVEVENAITAGKLELGGVEAEVLGFSEDGVLSYEQSKSYENVKTNSVKAEVSATAKLLDFNVGSAGGKGKTSIKTGTQLAAGDIVHNSIEFLVTGSDPEEVRYRTAEEYQGSIVGVTSRTQYFRDIYYTGSAAQRLSSSNNLINRLAQGKFTLLTPSSAREISELMIDSGYTGGLERVKDSAKTFSYPFIIGPSEDFSLQFGVAGSHSYQYTKETGIVQNRMEYLKSINELDAEIAENGSSFREVFDPIVAGICEDIQGMFASVTGSVQKGIEWMKAKVSGEKDWNVHISSFNPEMVASQGIAIMSLAADTGVESVSTTVGEPYVISATDADGNVISEFGEDGIDLSLYFDESDFINSGISYTDEMIAQLKIYRWNDEKNVYLVEDGIVDAENGCVTTKIYQPGQYILAIDTIAPEVTEFMVSSQLRTPTFSAVISDLSGLSDFSFAIDGVELVDETNFEDYFRAETGVFSYRVTNPLTSGNHIATISVSDSSGNSSGNIELAFTVSMKSLATTQGAAIRKKDPMGQRFTATISKSDIEVDGIEEFGMILVPTAALGSNYTEDDIQVGATLNGYAVATVPAKKIYEETDTELVYTAVLIGIAPQHYNREITARAYAKLADGTYVYADCTTRSIYEVAKKVLLNPEEELDENATKFVQGIVDYVDGSEIVINTTEPEAGSAMSYEITVDGYDATIKWSVIGGDTYEDTYVSQMKYQATVTLTTDGFFSPKDKVIWNGEEVTGTISTDSKTMTVTKEFELKDFGWSDIY